MSKMSSNSENRSVFVSDLSPDVTEAMLLSAFSTCGPILSVRICRHRSTQSSLGYGYVNFCNGSDARHAIHRLNATQLKDKQIRVMSAQSDPLERTSNKANVFIKNLDKSVDNKKLYEMFSPFGPILSYKLATDGNGRSKGHGFVQFQSEQSALSAILAVNGSPLNGRTVLCSKFMAKSERQKYMNTINGNTVHSFANIYVKNLSQELDDNIIEQLFSAFGKVVSAKLFTIGSKRFGFVALEDSHSAENAIQALNGKPLLNGNTLYVSRALKQRKRKQSDSRSAQIGYDGLKACYVKYLDQSFDKQKLKEVFEPFGTITSAKVWTNRSMHSFSNGFGFICFSTQESAQKAIQQMNNAIVVKTPLFVSMAQTIDGRNKNWIQMMQRMGGMKRKHSIGFP